MGKPTIHKIRAVRRYLRALRHGGRRRAGAGATKTLGQVNVIGWFLETFYVNFFLINIFGMKLAPLVKTTDSGPLATSGKRKTLDDDEDETTAEKLSEKNMAEYNESQDPDYEPTMESSEDSLEYDSQAEVSQESQEGAQEEVAEDTQESSQEGTVEDDACNTPACEKVEHKEVEQVKPMASMETEATEETTTTTTEETTETVATEETTEATVETTETVATEETTEETAATEEEPEVMRDEMEASEMVAVSEEKK